MNYTQQLKQKDSEYVWHPFTQMQDWLAQEPMCMVIITNT